jgi:ppGpp synthetase/RelA/SpoT-type nucleotidyltranferase
MPVEFLRLKNTLDAIWSSREAPPQTASSHAEAATKLVADYPPTPCDDLLSAEQRLTRALLACVLPFDLLTPRQWDARTRASPDTTGAPASAAAALEALMACQKALRDELRLSAVAPGLDVTVQGRLKSLWSTHTKMQRKECSAAEVYDARALRVVVEDPSSRDQSVETQACYSLLSAVHKLWRPVGGEYDDYIANAKQSGYQSLHTAVRAPDGAPLEVQVRTRAMHEEAEYGTAAHFRYKESATSSAPELASFAGAPNLMAAAAAVVEPIVKALATTDGGPAARAAAEFTAAATLRAAPAVAPSGAALFPTAPALAAPAAPARPVMSGRPRVGAGTPLLRVAEGRLNDAVVVDADESGGRLLVAVQFVERWGAAAGRRASAAEYDALALQVASRGWFSPGQGDFRVCLEEYALCSDGRFHKIDAYGRKLDACVEVLDLSAGAGLPPASSPARDAPDASGAQPVAARKPADAARSSGEEEALNDKVRLLRSLLTWEQDVYGTKGMPEAKAADAAGAGSATGDARPVQVPLSAVASEVLCIVWPQGKTLRLPAGSTAGDVAAKFMSRSDTSRVNVNNALVPSGTPLQDGDVVIIAAGD